MCACSLIVVCVSYLFQSQQPLEDLDAQLRRALSPETVPVSTHTQVRKTHMFGYDSVNSHRIYCSNSMTLLNTNPFSSPSMLTPGLSQWHTFSGTKYVC